MGIENQAGTQAEQQRLQGTQESGSFKASNKKGAASIHDLKEEYDDVSAPENENAAEEDVHRPHPPIGANKK